MGLFNKSGTSKITEFMFVKYFLMCIDGSMEVHHISTPSPPQTLTSTATYSDQCLRSSRSVKFMFETHSVLDKENIDSSLPLFDTRSKSRLESICTEEKCI